MISVFGIPSARYALICCRIPIVFGSSATAARTRSLGWVQLLPANSPPPRSYLAMTVDPASGKVIAFGGFDGTGYLNDTWTFDGRSWTQIASQVSPPARAAAQMTYDSVSHKVVLFGGYDGTNYLGDTWLWKGQRCSGHRPRPRINLQLSLVPCCFPIPMAGLIFLAGSTDNSTSSVCSNGTVPIGCSYFHRLFRLLALQQPLRRIL